MISKMTIGIIVAVAVVAVAIGAYFALYPPTKSGLTTTSSYGGTPAKNSSSALYSSGNSTNTAGQTPGAPPSNPTPSPIAPKY